jgi:hypothetical protein
MEIQPYTELRSYKFDCKPCNSVSCRIGALDRPTIDGHFNTALPNIRPLVSAGDTIPAATETRLYNLYIDVGKPGSAL